MTYKTSKRNFLKQCMVASCAMYCNFSNINLYASSLGLNQKKLQDQDLYTKPDDLYSIEALFYTKTPKGLKCQLCPNDCKIEDGEESDCRTRVNMNGKLVCVAYGNPCAIHLDPVEKKPLYHFLPSTKTFSIATAGCNLACLNCQNWEISQASPLDTRNYHLMPEDVVNKCIESNCKSISYTYSDPIVFYEYVRDTSKIAKEKNIKNIIVSAGYIYEEPLRLWCKYIDAANIDLKSFDNDVYEMLNAGTLEPVLNTLKVLRDEGVWLEITNLVVPNWTDDLSMIKKMCDWLYNNQFENTPLHFSRFFPQYKLTDLPPTPIEKLLEAREIAINSGLKYVYIGNAPETGKCLTFCPNCNNIVVERSGYSLVQLNILNNHCPNCDTKIAGIWE